MDFHNFFNSYVFEVEEFIADIPIDLPLLSNLENSDHLLVQEVFGGTDDVPYRFS